MEKLPFNQGIWEAMTVPNQMKKDLISGGPGFQPLEMTWMFM